MLAPPFNHNFNRSTVNFITSSGIQTYVPASAWAAVTPYIVGQTIIDSNGNGEKCIVAGTSGDSAPSWSSGLFVNTGDNSSVTWQNIGTLANISMVSNFGHIEKAMIQDINNGSVWKELGIALDLSRDSTNSCPKIISAQTDDNQGDISFRLMPPPGAAYPISIQYQQAQVPFTSLSQSWAPIPDRLYTIYNAGVLALSYLYKGDVARHQVASQAFIARMLSYDQGLSESQANQFMKNWGQTISETTLMQRSQQGVSARAAL